MSHPALQRRTAGVLLHPTSLPGPGVGDLGQGARRLVDWLTDAGQTFWQVLPLVPVDSGGSPYNGLSAMAGNPLLISPEELEAEGLLEDEWRRGPVPSSTDRVDFPAALEWKRSLFADVHERFRAAPERERQSFARFRERHAEWLVDFTLFVALKEFHGASAWSDWPAELRDRDPDALALWGARLAEEIEGHALQQFLFERQWRALRDYANARGILILGDLPIFVAYDSADVWANREIFKLGSSAEPTVVSGVPPDYFSATGQRWGNPQYRWDLLEDRGYDWWVSRFRRTLELVDVVRIDHFRGFESFWEIDATEETAVKGRWVAGPGAHFFRELERRLGPLPVVAEDLGIITPAVERLRDELGFPGMRVLQFAFDGDPNNPHLPENHPATSVAYTGTHDNDTTTGWWRSADAEERGRVREWLHGASPDTWRFIQSVLSSPARTAIIPVQDLLSLGTEARMNTPGEAASNWTWRMPELPSREVADRLRRLVEETGRLGGSSYAGSSDAESEGG